MAELQELLDYIDGVANESAVSRNVKSALEHIKTILTKEDSDINVRLDNAMQVAEELSANPNMPMHIKTLLWQLTSLLAASARS